MARDVYVVGSINVDLVVTAATLPGPGETVTGGTFERHGGGKSANQAVAAARPGAAVRMVGRRRRRRSRRGGRRAACERRAIDVSGLARLERRATGVALIVVDEAGENQIAVASGANTELDAGAVERGLSRARRPAASCCSGSRCPTRRCSRARGPRARRTSRSCSILRRRAPLPDELLALSPVLTPNSDEAARSAARTTRRRRRARSRTRTGAPVVVTIGPAGALLADGDALERIPAPKVEAVDTTGAGDAFNGALAAALAGGAGLADAVRDRDRVAAADSVTRRGAGGRPQCMKYLPIYLNDHYAGSTAGVELAKRAAKQQPRQRRVRPRARRAWRARSTRTATRSSGSWTASTSPRTASRRRSSGWARRSGASSPTASCCSFSPLSRVVELEGLITGVSGKLSLWRALLELAAREPGSTRASSTCSPAAPRTSCCACTRCAARPALIAFVGDIA